MSVDFGDKGARLVTGDVVLARLTLPVPSERAMQLSLAAAASGGFSDRRRMLSKEHEAARRMVLKLSKSNNSSHSSRRRIVQEFLTVRDILSNVDVASLGGAVKSDLAVVVGKETSGKDLFISYDGQQLNMTSVTFVFRSCGLIPALNASTVRDYLYDSPKIPANLGRWFNVCTYNQLTFMREHNILIELNVPCTGYYDLGAKYDLKNGRANGRDHENEMWALPSLAKSHLEKVDYDMYRRWKTYRKVYIWTFNWFTSYVPWGGLVRTAAAGRAYV
ncbi:hypothetical protein PLESTM_000563900 [Pleodorina starrii]|nr:hypothetical protein PLESTM_000563900 [Pleodorina starrii]